MFTRANPIATAALGGQLICACSPPTQTDHAQRPTASSSTAIVSTATPSGSASAPPSYDVHEWGLVRAEQNGKLRIGAVAPPIPPEVFIVTKPVLYFLADAPMTLKQVLVTAPSGSFPETWPLADPGPDEHSISWSNVSIDPQSACPFSPLPRKGDLPCSKLSPKEECESLGLAAVRTVDASCVRVKDKTESFLFYRVTTEALSPPLRFTNQSDGKVLVMNDSDETVPGLLIRIETVQTETRTLTVKPPGPRASIVVGRDFPKARPIPNDESEPPPAVIPRVVTGTAREDIRGTMRELGLADSEIDAFMKAWDETLFGSPSKGGFRPVKGGTTFLYFLPETTLQRAAKVVFDPPPRSFRRACAVWTQVTQ